MVMWWMWVLYRPLCGSYVDIWGCFYHTWCYWTGTQVSLSGFGMCLGFWVQGEVAWALGSFGAVEVGWAGLG